MQHLADAPVGRRLHDGVFFGHEHRDLSFREIADRRHAELSPGSFHADIQHSAGRGRATDDADQQRQRDFKLGCEALVLAVN